MVCKIEWHSGELFSRIGFIVSNSRLTAGEIVKVYNGRGEVENRIKEGKNTLRWDKTSCHSFDANHARLKMGVLAYNLLHLIREFYLVGEEVRRSMEWLIRRLIKVGAKCRITPGSGACISHRPSRWPFITGRFLVMDRPSALFLREV